MTDRPARYHPLLRVLHWLIATLVILQLAVGSLGLEALPNTPEKAGPLAGHVVVGLAVGALMLIRLVARFATRKPAPARSGSVALDWLRRIVHFLFYVVVFSMISTGLGIVLMANLWPALFGPGGELPPSFAVFPPRIGHEFFSRVLLALVLLHVAGALYHQLVLKDRLLSRMGFGRERRAAGATQTLAREARS